MQHNPLPTGLLVALRLPSGWTVRLNNWFYHEPLLPSGISNRLFVSEGQILLLSRYGTNYLNHPHWSRDFYLDLHWLGDAATGEYHLRFYEDGDDDLILADFRSRSALEIQQKINDWLDAWSIDEFPPA
jgi:hypothetical protein